MASDSFRAPIKYPADLFVGTEVTLGIDHVRALRFREINAKEAFTLMDLSGRFFRAALTSLEADAGRAKIYEAMESSPESPAQITMLCAVLARQRMLGVIQKATELGAAAVVPVLSERSVQESGLSHEKAHAWPAQALRAARQCRRASIPAITQALRFENALEHPGFRDADIRYYLDDLGPNHPLPTPHRVPGQRIAFVVGPEGGFTDPERNLLRSKGAVALRLGGRVLRAETAALVGLAFLQHLHGDM